ncbi:Prebacteriocin [Lacticaseibacillus paracasei subsp. paracasei Lpp70]|nr:Prebacteriocin [Lacticaseibacillus paracasei subsp. paracasei Lpp70]
MGGKETRLFQAIDGAYNDAAVQQDDEIKRFLFESAQRLVSGDRFSYVAARLDSFIASYSQFHHFQYPSALEPVYKLVAGASMRARGGGGLSVWL